MDRLKDNDGNYDRTFRILVIALASFVTGLAWRIRGDGPFGGSLGMMVPAIVLNLVILYAFGHFKKISSAEIGLMIIAMAITAAGWGTINSQTTGIFTHEALPDSSTQIMINPLSGCFAVFVIGFGWVPLWSATIGRFFSDQKYKSREFLVRILIYFAASYLSMATVAHLIMPLVAPGPYGVFVEGLAAEGYDMMPWQAYMTHFKNNDWLEAIPGGRNYGSMINNLSQCFGAIVLYFYMRYAYKDKTAAKIHIMLCLIFGLSILIADVWLFWDRGGLWRTSLIPPEWLHGWSMWEYSTGFLAGGLTMWYLFRQKPPSISEGETEDDLGVNGEGDGEQRDIQENVGHDHFIEERWIPFWRFFAAWGFVCVFSWVNPLGGELNRTYETTFPIQMFGAEFELTFRIIVIAVAFLIFLPISILILKDKVRLPDWSIQKWAIVDLMIFLHLFCVVYFWADSWATFITNISTVVNSLMVSSYFAVIILIITIGFKYAKT